MRVPQVRILGPGSSGQAESRPRLTSEDPDVQYPRELRPAPGINFLNDFHFPWVRRRPVNTPVEMTNLKTRRRARESPHPRFVVA